MVTYVIEIDFARLVRMCDVVKFEILIQFHILLQNRGSG